MATFRERILRSSNAKQLADAFQMVIIAVPRDELISPLQTAILGLRKITTYASEDTATVTSMHQMALEKAQSHLQILETSRASLNNLQAEYKREISIMKAKIETVMSNDILKWEDQQDTVVLLCDTIMDIRNMYLTNVAAWNTHIVSEEQCAIGSLSRIDELLAHAKESFAVEGAVRARVTRELEHTHREQVAENLLNDGILVWVSRRNVPSVLMTQARMSVEDLRLTIEPTQLCLDSSYLPSIQEKYDLSSLDIDFGTLKVTIDLRDVVELQLLNRQAVLPGAADRNGLHYEPPLYQKCAYVKTQYGREYWMTDRKNEIRGKAWASVREAQDDHASLLYEKLSGLWRDAKRGADI